MVLVGAAAAKAKGLGCAASRATSILDPRCVQLKLDRIV